MGKQFSLYYWFISLFIQKILAMGKMEIKNRYGLPAFLSYNPQKESETDGWTRSYMKQRELMVLGQQVPDDWMDPDARKNFLWSSAWVEIRMMNPGLGDGSRGSFQTQRTACPPSEEDSTVHLNKGKAWWPKIKEWGEEWCGVEWRVGAVHQYRDSGSEQFGTE